MMALKTRPLGEYSFNYFRFTPFNLHCFPDSIGPTSLTTHLDRLKRGFSSDLFSVVLFSNHNHRFFPRPFQCFHRYFFCDTLDCDPWVFVVFSCSSIGPNGVRLFLFSSKNFSIFLTKTSQYYFSYCLARPCFVNRITPPLGVSTSCVCIPGLLNSLVW